MGQPAHVDVAAVLSAAGHCEHVADLLDDAVRTRLAQLSFGAATAGRAYGARGDAVRDAIEQLGDDVRTWARACAEIASILRASADGYAMAEARGAARLV